VDDFLTKAQEEDVAGKIAWYNQQLVVVKDDFTRWLGELGYTVDQTFFTFNLLTRFITQASAVL
jgi:hypothetical protein